MKELTQEIIRDAIIEGAKNSKYGRDPDSNEPGDLATFFTNVCNENVAAFCVLLGAMIQQETQTEPSVEPQHAETNVGRLQ
jgi:hypothetical protein